MSLKQVLDLLVMADTHSKILDAPAPTKLQGNLLSSTLAGFGPVPFPQVSTRKTTGPMIVD